MGSSSLIDVLSETRSFQTRHGSRVAVVGGGMLGTVLALRYGQAGRIVTLFEASERADRRGHASISSSDRGLAALLDELNLAQTIQWGNARTFGMRFGALAGGRARIVEALRDRARAIHVDVRLGMPVREILTDGSGFGVDTGGETSEFDEVVMTVPSPVAWRLLPALPTRERSVLLEAGYVGIMNVSFVLERSLGRRYISRVTRGRDTFTLLDPTALAPSDDRNTTVYVTRPLATTDRLFDADDRNVIEQFARALPGNARIMSARVMRVPHAFADRQALPFTNSIPRLSIVNAAHMGVGRHHLERTALLATSAFRKLCSETIV